MEAGDLVGSDELLRRMACFHAAATAATAGRKAVGKGASWESLSNRQSGAMTEGWGRMRPSFALSAGASGGRDWPLFFSCCHFYPGIQLETELPPRRYL
jgi:hypothetical protein